MIFIIQNQFFTIMLKIAILLIVSLIVAPVAIVYLDATPTEEQWVLLTPLLWMCFGIATACFLLSEITKNYSQVDKLWSLVPLVYSWYVAFQMDFAPRMLLMAVLVTLWGLRLSYNFSRRGGYSLKFWTGEEDYRWAVLRARPELSGRVRWTLFNLFFISYYQQFLILFFTLPIVVAAQAGDSPLGWADYAVAAAVLFFLILETVADQQQWVYQNEKYRQKAAGKMEPFYAVGFTHHGLWKWMRHPNYMAEQAIWVCFYFFGVAATGNWLNWTLSGPLLLMVLFQGSADFSEGISAEKYPLYKAYMSKVGRFLPNFWQNPKFY